MNAKKRTFQTILCLLILSLALAACSPKPVPTAAPTVTPTATPQPALSIDDTEVTLFQTTKSDFDLRHAPVEGDPNKFLILGGEQVETAAADLDPRLAAFLGRWEGYLYAPPVNKDRKLILVVQEINAEDGKAVGMSGTNLQYLDANGEIHFRVLPGETPSIQWKINWPDGTTEVDTFSIDPGTGELVGQVQISGQAAGVFKLTRDRSFSIYRSYSQYLAELGISTETYQNGDLLKYGQGYMLYLPNGYMDQPDKAWPLIVFLHGYGDRGDNVSVLAKASPFMYIREKGPLPAIIAAPLLNSSPEYASFPVEYLDGVVTEIQSQYRVDPQRLYLTGLSMGGEATYRYALHQPDRFAALAPLSAYLDQPDLYDLKSIQDLPIWAIHGENDIVVPLAKAQQVVDALKAAGNDVRFTVLPGHDHDTWTDTYSDPAFYDWLFQQVKQ